MLLDVFHLSLHIHFATLTLLSAGEDWLVWTCPCPPNSSWVWSMRGRGRRWERPSHIYSPGSLPAGPGLVSSSFYRQTLLMATALSRFQWLILCFPKKVGNFLLVLVGGYLLVSFKSAQAFVNSTFIKLSLISPLNLPSLSCQDPEL